MAEVRRPAAEAGVRVAGWEVEVVVIGVSFREVVKLVSTTLRRPRPRIVTPRSEPSCHPYE